MIIPSAATAVIAAAAPWLTILALCAWGAALLLLVAPAWRLAQRRTRYLDALWGVILLGVVNRLASDFAHVPAELQHVSAIIVAVLLAAVVRSYQHADR